MVPEVDTPGNTNLIYALGIRTTNGTGGLGDPICLVTPLTPMILLMVKEGKTSVPALTALYSDYSEYLAKATTMEHGAVDPCGKLLT